MILRLFPSPTLLSRASFQLSRSTTSAGRWPAICGGPGIRKSSTSSAISIPIRWRQLDHNPDRPAARVHAGAAGPAGGRDGALQPHQLRPSPAEGIHGQPPDVGGLERGRARLASRWPISRPSSASTNRCRFIPAAWACSPATTSKAPAAWACRSSRSACSTTRAISSSSSTATAASSEEYHRYARSKTCRWSRPSSPEGKPITVRVETRTGPLFAKVWLMQVGRVRLYLLDCDVEGNSPQDRELDQPAVRRRRADPHSPGAGARRRRREGAARHSASRRASIT